MGAGADSAEETDLVDDGPSSGRVNVDVITGGLFSHEKARSNEMKRQSKSQEKKENNQQIQISPYATSKATIINTI